MKTTVRFEQAVQKLYNAFHNDTLIPACCKQCAVGNILDQTDSWKHLSDQHGSLQLNYVGKVHQRLGRTFNGYSPLELLHLEATFLQACGYRIPYNSHSKPAAQPNNKDILFQGLSAVVAYLCSLDGIPNIMDCEQLFDYSRATLDAPKPSSVAAF